MFKFFVELTMKDGGLNSKFPHNQVKHLEVDNVEFTWQMYKLNVESPEG